MREHFIRWIEADKNIAALKTKLDEIQSEIKKLEDDANDARLAISDEMKESGVVEDLIEGEYSDYCIYFTTGRESVKVENPDAVPDEFCKIERKPKLKEIKAHIDEGNAVNWACIERGEGKLAYKIKKKG